MKPTHAWVRLTRLNGCNYKVPVTYRGTSVMVPDPQDKNRRYRLDAGKFERGDWQGRNDWTITPWDARAAATNDWTITPWDARAAATNDSEMGWQD